VSQTQLRILAQTLAVIMRFLGVRRCLDGGRSMIIYWWHQENIPDTRPDVVPAENCIRAGQTLIDGVG
jgi:hypothetical protein